ncbi:MAG TPA: DUF3800 domain-containing protein [Terriglobales bacterium]|jgi:hypothetical protein
MLKAFIDDSGSGGDSPWFVLAGYIGTAESWDVFGDSWRTVLNGPPRLDYFKASEAESLRENGQWAGVSVDQRNAIINSLIHVIGKHALRSISVRVNQTDYNEIIKPYVPPVWDHAYYYLFTGFMAAATSAEKYFGKNDPIEFYFDNTDKKLKKRSRMLYGQVANIPQFRNRVHDIHYEDEKTVLPLQAADLLAWQIRRRFCIEEQPRPQFEAAINCPPERSFNHTITREQLEDMGKAMDENAMLKWALSGQSEASRPWKRPR